MHLRSYSLLLLAAAVASGSCAGLDLAATRVSSATGTSHVASPPGWLKGQLHMHTAESPDSDAPVADMVQRYEELGFDFIVITDHNLTTDGSDHGGRVKVYPGVELSQERDACPPPPFDPVEAELGWCHIHVGVVFGAIVPERNIPWGVFSHGEPVGLSQFLLETARHLGGIAVINHPDEYGLGSTDLLVEQWLRGAAMVEIVNTSTPEWRVPPNHAGMEAIWDGALSRGAILWGIATDDAHAVPEIGSGWVMVRSENSAEEIVGALRRGDFYASTGVVLSALTVTEHQLTLKVQGSVPHRIEFIGSGGVTLSATLGLAAAYDLPPDGYVRAVITAPDGAQAWIQPASSQPASR